MSSNSLRLWIIVSILVYHFYATIGIEEHEATDLKGISRHKRGTPLIFNNASVFRLLCGFGIPVDELELESVTTGATLIVRYNLPHTGVKLKKITPFNINERLPARERSLEFDNTHLSLMQYRWLVYHAIEAYIKRQGHDGHACMLKAICEAAQHPFQTDGGLLNELFHILLTPSSSVDDYTVKGARRYMEAEKLGVNGAYCNDVFQACPISYLDKVSAAFHLHDYDI